MGAKAIKMGAYLQVVTQVSRDFKHIRHTIHIEFHDVCKGKYSRFSMPCTSVCGMNLRRPHLTCLYCWSRKVFYGKMKNNFEGDYFLVPVKKNLPLYRRIILKELISLAEFVGRI